jgi:OmpA-OmpF porin, OOP family
MEKHTCKAATLASLLLCVAMPGMAQSDVKGSKDHPLISRYPGSYITDYFQKEYDEIILPLGKGNSKQGKFEKSQHLEGKITGIVYRSPAGRSELEIFRNYESAVKQAGFETLFDCAKEACADGGRYTLYGNGSWDEYWWPSHDIRYLSAKLSRQQGDAYVSVFVEKGPGTNDGPTVTLFVIEMKPMETGLVTVDAATLAADLTRIGHASVYGIYFDTGKADVKPESDATLAEIGKLLKQDASLKLYVVGHTDNVGTLANNMDLSKRRADAVVKILTIKYSISAARLSAQGDGPLAPVASNDTEDGRAKNRRVELVKQ